MLMTEESQDGMAHLSQEATLAHPKNHKEAKAAICAIQPRFTFGDARARTSFLCFFLFWPLLDAESHLLMFPPVGTNGSSSRWLASSHTTFLFYCEQ